MNSFKPLKTTTYIVSVIFTYTLLTACTTQTTQPWQKQNLSRPEMQLNANSIESSFEEHFYFSKEGSSGGKSFSGGGCGCN